MILEGWYDASILFVLAKSDLSHSYLKLASDDAKPLWAEWGIYFVWEINGPTPSQNKIESIIKLQIIQVQAGGCQFVDRWSKTWMTMRFLCLRVYIACHCSSLHKLAHLLSGSSLPPPFRYKLNLTCYPHLINIIAIHEIMYICFLSMNKWRTSLWGSKHNWGLHHTKALH